MRPDLLVTFLIACHHNFSWTTRIQSSNHVTRDLCQLSFKTHPSYMLKLPLSTAEVIAALQKESLPDPFVSCLGPWWESLSISIAKIFNLQSPWTWWKYMLSFKPFRLRYLHNWIDVILFVSWKTPLAWACFDILITLSNFLRALPQLHLVKNCRVVY